MTKKEKFLNCLRLLNQISNDLDTLRVYSIDDANRFLEDVIKKLNEIPQNNFYWEDLE